jgi:hypothetical protein
MPVPTIEWSHAVRWRRTCLSTPSLLLAMATSSVAPAWAGAGDPYGGAGSVKRKATGFFRLDELGGRHFLITPDGHPFRALGLNHYHMITSRDYGRAIQNLRDWGFNSGGYQAPRWQWNRIPHTRGIILVPNSNWMRPGTFAFRDVFDPTFLNELEQNIRRVVEPSSENPFLVGYFWTDVPLWTARRQSKVAEGDAFWGQDWISFYKGLPEDAAGRKVWEDWRSEHPDAAEGAFLAVIARQLYSKAHALTRKHDPNHLIFGDRYFEPDMPEEVIREALPFIDAIAIQPTTKTFQPDFFTRLSKRYGKPIYIADHVTSYRTPEHPNTMGQVTTGPESYVAYYTEYVTSALSHPSVVGYNKCQYQDQLVSPGFLKQGLLKTDGTPRPTVDGIGAANRKALEAAYSF